MSGSRACGYARSGRLRNGEADAAALQPGVGEAAKRLL